MSRQSPQEENLQGKAAGSGRCGLGGGSARSLQSAPPRGPAGQRYAVLCAPQCVSRGTGRVDVPVGRARVGRGHQLLDSTKFAGTGKNPSAATNCAWHGGCSDLREHSRGSVGFCFLISSAGSCMLRKRSFAALMRYLAVLVCARTCVQGWDIATDPSVPSPSPALGWPGCIASRGLWSICISSFIKTRLLLSLKDDNHSLFHVLQHSLSLRSVQKEKEKKGKL